MAKRTIQKIKVYAYAILDKQGNLVKGGHDIGMNRKEVGNRLMREYKNKRIYLESRGKSVLKFQKGKIPYR